MTTSTWRGAPFAIHVDAAAGALEAEARDAGGVVVRLPLGGLGDRTALCDRIAEVFEFPYPSSGLDAATDFVSDLEWLDGGTGFLVVVEAGDAPAAVLADLASILPFATDRWRAQEKPFVVAFSGLADRGPVLTALAEANASLAEAGALPWAQPGTGPVPVLTDS